MSVLVTIDIGDGRLDNLRIWPHTDLRQAALAFCKKHNLSVDNSAIIVEEIVRNSSSLHNEAQQPLSQTQGTNPGVRLYEKGLKYMEIINDKIKKFKKMKEEQERKNLTFSPKINKSNYASSVDILLKCGVQTRQRLEKMRGEKLNLEINECTFTPKINRKSDGLASKRRSLTPEKEASTSFGSSMASTWNVYGLCRNRLNRSAVYENLHLDARSRSESRQKSQEMYYTELFTFRPDLSKTKEEDQKYLQKRGKYPRISDYRKQLDYYLRVRALDTDLKTGQALFKPKINDFQFSTKKSPSPTRPCCKHKASKSKLTPSQLQRIVRRIEFLKGSSTSNNSFCNYSDSDQHSHSHCKNN